MRFNRFISSLFLLLTLVSCQSEKEVRNGNFGGSSSLQVTKKKVETIDLFDKEAPTPAACYTSLQVTKEFSIFRGYVNACVDIMLGDVSLISFYETKKCLTNIGVRFKSISEQACKDTMITGAPGGLEDVNKLLLHGYFDNKIVTYNSGEFSFNWDNGLDITNPSYIPYVQNFFSLVGEWQQQTRDELYKNSAGMLVMSRAQGDFLEVEILKKFWDALQAHSQEWKDTFGQIPTNPVGVQQAKLFQIFDTILTINQKVIDKVFASELGDKLYLWSEVDVNPGPSPVLAAIIGDSLAPFYERIRTLTKIYDVACKLNSCYDEFYDSNETVWMLRFFEAIGQGNFTEELIFDEDDVRPLSVFIRSLYAKKETIKDSIDKMNETFGVSKIYTIVPGADFPHFLQSFYNVFAEGHDLIASYDSTKKVDSNGDLRGGFFHGGTVSEINVGFSKINMDQHISEVSKVNSELSTLSQSFVGQHNQLVNNTLGINNSQITLGTLTSQIEQDITEIVNQKLQIDAIRNFIYEREQRYGEKVNQIIQNLGSSSETFVKVGGDLTLQVPATSTMGIGSFADIGKIKLNFPAPLQKGDMVRISVNGEYQPNCAIEANYGTSVSGARTGSRGYTSIFSKGKSHVKSVNKYKTNEAYSDASITARACSGSPSAGSFFSGASFQVCAQATAGARTSKGSNTSDTNSDSTRSDSSFDLGLTLQNTPYPASAAGSLLLVEMPIDQQTQIEEVDKRKYSSIRTLTNSSTFLARSEDSQSNYYFVVNDCGTGARSGELFVTVQVYRASGAQVQQFINKVTAVLPELESQVSGLIDQGILGEGTLSTLRSQLIGVDYGGTSLSDFSGNIRILLESFIDSQMDTLRYKSQISSLERALEMKKQNMLSLIDHFEDEVSQKYLKVSQRNWNLANMDLDFVNTEGTNRNLYTLSRVINILEHSLVSYLDFKYDEERKRAIIGNITLLTQLNFSSAFDDIALNMTTFMTTLLDNIKDDLNNRPVTPKVSMGIHIPNPYYTKPVGFPDAVYSFPKMDDFRAQQFWDAIYAWKRGRDGAKLNFDVIYQDLYADRGLGCYVEAPIIDSMGVYFIPENQGYVTDFNRMYKNRNAKLYLNGLSLIPFGNEPRAYNFVNQDWRFMDSAVRMATSPMDALDRLATEFPANIQVETGLSTGRSPFGYFQIGDLPAYNYNSATDTVLLGDTPLNEIRELFIAYNFAASNNDFNVNLSWLDYCSPSKRATYNYLMAR